MCGRCGGWFLAKCENYVWRNSQGAVGQTIHKPRTFIIIVVFLVLEGLFKWNCRSRHLTTLSALLELRTNWYRVHQMLLCSNENETKLLLQYTMWQNNISILVFLFVSEKEMGFRLRFLVSRSACICIWEVSGLVFENLSEQFQGSSVRYRAVVGWTLTPRPAGAGRWRRWLPLFETSLFANTSFKCNYLLTLVSKIIICCHYFKSHYLLTLVSNLIIIC